MEKDEISIGVAAEVSGRAAPAAAKIFEFEIGYFNSGREQHKPAA